MKKIVLAIALTFLLTGSSMACGISAFATSNVLAFNAFNSSTVVQRQVIRQRAGFFFPRRRIVQVQRIRAPLIQRNVQIQRFRSNLSNLSCVNGECLIY